MKFTAVFESHESKCLAYELAFVAGPCWLTSQPGGNWDVFINLASRPDYQMGSVAKLIEAVPAVGKARSVVVVVHTVGHGTEKDLRTLVDDLQESGFATSVVYMPPMLETRAL